MLPAQEAARMSETTLILQALTSRAVRSLLPRHHPN